MSVTIIVQGITIDELLRKIETIIDRKVKEDKSSLREDKPFRYLSRADVAGMLKISLPTLHGWTKTGRLKSYKIGNRVYYRSDELQASIERK